MTFIVSFHNWINVLPSSGETLNLMEYNRTVKKKRLSVIMFCSRSTKLIKVYRLISSTFHQILILLNNIPKYKMNSTEIIT